MKNKSDDDLIKLISKGDQKAFKELFSRYGNVFLGYAMSLMKDKSIAEDISQDVWIKIVKLAPSYEGKGQFVAWCYTMIRNQSFNILKSKNWSAQEELENFSETLSVASFEDELINEESLEAIKDTIKNLPEAQRISLSIWLNENLSYEEIADQMNLSVGAVKTHIFRAKETIKRKLGRVS